MEICSIDNLTTEGTVDTEFLIVALKSNRKERKVFFAKDSKNFKHHLPGSLSIVLINLLGVIFFKNMEADFFSLFNVT